MIGKIFFQRDKGIIGGQRREKKRVDTKMERHDFPSLLSSVRRETFLAPCWHEWLALTTENSVQQPGISRFQRIENRDNPFRESELSSRVGGNL